MAEGLFRLGHRCQEEHGTLAQHARHVPHRNHQGTHWAGSTAQQCPCKPPGSLEPSTFYKHGQACTRASCTYLHTHLHTYTHTFTNTRTRCRDIHKHSAPTCSPGSGAKPLIQPSNSTMSTGPLTSGHREASARSPRPSFLDLSYLHSHVRTSTHKMVMRAHGFVKPPTHLQLPS